MSSSWLCAKALRVVPRGNASARRLQILKNFTELFRGMIVLNDARWAPKALRRPATTA